MNEERHDNDVVDDRPYSRRWLMRGAAAFAVAGGIGSIGMVRWASATGGDDDYEDRESLDDDDHDDRDDRDDHDDHDDDDHSGGDDRDDDDHDDRDDDDEAVSAGAAAPGENRVEIRDEDAFTPSSITINAGEWVTWINFDDDEHTATGQDFDTGELDTGARAEIQFNTPGSYTYVCQFHPEMVGEVIVLGGDATPQASPEASPAASPQATPAAGGGGQETVSIIDFAFEPQTLQVSAGTTVVWTNDGEAPHTVTGDSLDSGTLSSGDSFQFTFSTAGTFDYICDFHPQMTGTIEVTA